MQRLFSTFADGWPGVGLLLMRLVSAIVVVARGITRLSSGLPGGPNTVEVVGIAAGILVMVGLWTPASASLVAVLGVWNALSQPGDPSANILLCAMGFGLALVGPGAWSVDARLFGFRRIDVDRKR